MNNSTSRNNLPLPIGIRHFLDHVPGPALAAGCNNSLIDGLIFNISGFLHILGGRNTAGLVLRWLLQRIQHCSNIYSSREQPGLQRTTKLQMFPKSSQMMGPRSSNTARWDLLACPVNHDNWALLNPRQSCFLHQLYARCSWIWSHCRYSRL